MYCRTLHLAFKEATPALAVLAALAPGKEGVKIVKYVAKGQDGAKITHAHTLLKGWIETDAVRLEHSKKLHTETSGDKFHIIYTPATASYCMKSMFSDMKMAGTAQGNAIFIEALHDPLFRPPIPTIGSRAGEEAKAGEGSKRKQEEGEEPRREQRENKQEGEKRGRFSDSQGSSKGGSSTSKRWYDSYANMRSVMTLVLVSLFAHVVQLTCRKAEHGREVHQATETSRPKKGRSTAHSPPQRNTNVESGGNTVTQARPASAGG